jgi:TPR repeat protein
MYYHGQGLLGRAEANHWLRKAAEQGDANARSILCVRLTMWRKVFLLIQAVGGILLVAGSLLSRKTHRGLREAAVPLTGILCLFSAGLTWYGYVHHMIWCVTFGVNAFTIFKWLLNAIVTALLAYIVLPDKKETGQPMASERTA